MPGMDRNDYPADGLKLGVPPGFELTVRGGHPDFLDLEWRTALSDWRSDRLVDVARGVSRHVVRFIDYSGDVYAVKELPHGLAQHEYDLLRELDSRGLPVVEGVGVACRPDPLDDVLITRHLAFSLPYRYLFAGRSVVDLQNRILDALAVLLVRLHLEGFAWGDCSLSNALFRRDAGALSAYLVDAETGVLRPRLSDGQRAHDLELTVENVGGELLDLQAGRGLRPEADPFEIALDLRKRYEKLWTELSHEELISLPHDRRRLDARIQRLHDLGFDVAELTVRSGAGGTRVRVIPKVVELGHHRRRLQQLTGLDVGENQARRLLNDIDGFGHELRQTESRTIPEAFLAYRWLTEIYAPTIEAIPAELRDRLDEAEVFHQVLEHRWFLSEDAGRDVGMAAAVVAYVKNVLRHTPEELAVLPEGLGGG